MRIEVKAPTEHAKWYLVYFSEFFPEEENSQELRVTASQSEALNQNNEMENAQREKVSQFYLWLSCRAAGLWGQPENQIWFLNSLKINIKYNSTIYKKKVSLSCYCIFNLYLN